MTPDENMTAPLEANPMYAGAVVTAPDGRILCQLRDNKTGIVCPGVWSCCPGGRVEAGETPRDAILRELREEFEVEVASLKSFSTHIEDAGEFQGIYHAFYADLVTPVSDVKCNEGARAEFFPLEQAIELPQHPVSLIFLQTYYMNSAKSQ